MFSAIILPRLSIAVIDNYDKSIYAAITSATCLAKHLRRHGGGADGAVDAFQDLPDAADDSHDAFVLL